MLGRGSAAAVAGEVELAEEDEEGQREASVDDSDVAVLRRGVDHRIRACAERAFSVSSQRPQNHKKERKRNDVNAAKAMVPRTTKEKSWEICRRVRYIFHQGW